MVIFLLIVITIFVGYLCIAAASTFNLLINISGDIKALADLKAEDIAKKVYDTYRKEMDAK